MTEAVRAELRGLRADRAELAGVPSSWPEPLRPPRRGIKPYPRDELLDAIWNIDLPAEFVERLRLELLGQGVEWTPGTYTRVIPQTKAGIRFNELLRDAGIDPKTPLSELRGETLSTYLEVFQILNDEFEGRDDG